MINAQCLKPHHVSEVIELVTINKMINGTSSDTKCARQLIKTILLKDITY
jgi:hypothetical protein